MAWVRNLSPELQVLDEQVTGAVRHVLHLASQLSESQFQWSPGPRQWSIAQCLDHLNRTASASLPVLKEAIKLLPEKRLWRKREMQLPWLERLIVRFIEPPPRLRLKSPESLKPLAGISKQDAVATFCRLNEKIAQLIEEAEGFDLTRVGLALPFIPLLRFTLAGALHMLLAHQRRHIWQMQRLMLHPCFPLE